MKKRAVITGVIVTLLIVGMVAIGCKKNGGGIFGSQAISGYDQTVIDGGLKINQPTYAPTGEPGLLVNNESAVGAVIDVQVAGTSALYVDSSGNTTISGTCSGCSIASSSNLVIAGPTAMATATPMVYMNTAADAPDLLTISKDATPVVFVHNSGEAEFDGNINADGNLDVDGTTNLDDADIDLSSSLNIDGHMVDIGTCTTPATADGDNDLCVAGDIEVDGTTDLDGDLNIAGLLLTSFSNLAVTSGDTLTPTVTVYALDTTGAVTMTLAASASEGQLLILINDDANETTINDTNIRTSDGNALVLAGAYDIAVFIYQDSEWLELLTIANS